MTKYNKRLFLLYKNKLKYRAQGEIPIMQPMCICKPTNKNKKDGSKNVQIKA